MTEKKLSQFRHKVGKHRLANTVPASFNTIAGQMTEMYQRKKNPGPEKLLSAFFRSFRDAFYQQRVCLFQARSGAQNNSATFKAAFRG